MSIWDCLTKPGVAQIYLLVLITVLFYLELRMMPLKCFVEIRAQQQRLSYNPEFLLAPEQNFCRNYSYLLVYQTKMSDRGKRDFFREALSSYAKQYNFTTVFPVGVSLNRTLNNALLLEHKLYGDMLQADFLDTYRNLTLKTYSYTRYISQNCSSVLAVLKIDDDIVFNIPQMFGYLSKIDLEENTLHCRTVRKPLVIRNKTSKWYTSMKEYPYKYFPDYCLSPIYAATPSTFKMLHDETKYAPYIWLDDVFSTGIVAREAGVTFRNLTVNTDSSDYASFLNGTAIAQYVYKTSDMISLFEGSNSSIFDKLK